MKEIKNVYIIGRGAVGLAFGIQFQNSCPDHFAFLVDEKRKQAYEKNPVKVNGKYPDFRYLVPSDQAEKADVIIITTKMSGLEEAMDLAEPFLKDDTLILSGINGILSEEILRKRFGRDRVIRAIAQKMDSCYFDNQADFTTVGELVFGAEDESDLENVQALQTFFDQTGFEYVLSSNIVKDAWSKLMLNCALNQICAVNEATYGGIISQPELFEQFVLAMKEVQQVAASQGIILEDALLDDWVQAVKDLDEHSMPSMAQDVKAKRKTEKELFSGTIIPLAEKSGIDVPLMKKLYEQLSAKESEYEKEKD